MNNPMTMIIRGAFALLTSLAFACDLSANAGAPVQIWGRQLGTTAEDFAGALAVDRDGNCYLAGATGGDLAGKNAGKGDIVVGKFDPTGRSLWLRQFGTAENDGARSIALDPAGNVYVTGGTRGRLGSTQFGKADGFVAKLDSLGQIVWLEQFGTAADDAGQAMACDASGSAFVTGITTAKPDGTALPAPDVFVRKFAPDGHCVWIRQWGTDGADDGRSIAVGPQGDLFVTGATAGDLAGQGNAGKTDLFVTKLDPAGNVVWHRQFGTPAADVGMKLLVDREGNLYVGGSSGGDLAAPQTGQGDSVLLKLSPNGELLWKRQFGTERWDGIHGLAFLPDGASGVIVGGCQNYDQCQAFLRAFDAEGHELWQTKIATDQTMCGTQVAIDGHGNIYQVGGTHGPAFGAYAGTGNDIFLVKLSAEDTPTKP
jgi:hypothetical protein